MFELELGGVWFASRRIMIYDGNEFMFDDFTIVLEQGHIYQALECHRNSLFTARW